MTFGHPMVSGKPAIFVGGHYILRDIFGGFEYVRFGSKGLVECASIKMIERDGKAPMMVLSQQSTNPDFLVHVNVILPENMTPREKFSFGVHTDGGKIEVRHGAEALVSLPKGASVNIFFPDGSVRRLVRDGFKLSVVKLTALEMGLARLEWTQSSLDELRVANLSSEVRDPRQDAVLHQVATVLKFGGGSSEILEIGFGILKEYADNGAIRLGVKTHALEVLRDVSPAYALILNQVCNEMTAKRFSAGAFGDIQAEVCSKPTSKGDSDRKAREAKLAARRLKDQELRALMQGKSGGGTTSHSQGGKKKKKK